MLAATVYSGVTYCLRAPSCRREVVRGALFLGVRPSPGA